MPLDIQITRTMSIVFLTFESALIFQKPKKKKRKSEKGDQLYPYKFQNSQMSDVSGNNFQHT